MGIWDRLFGKGDAERDPDAPFMEHPTGKFKSAMDAMTDTIQRLRALREWNDWITFCAQGMEHDEDSEHHAEIRMRRDEVELEKPVDVEMVAQRAAVPRSGFTAVGEHYSVAGASAAEAARILDAIFRYDLGIRPFPDEGDDYAVGAEW